MEFIFDRIRGVNLKATPEEIVRQRVICWLEEGGIVPAGIGREVPVEVVGRTLRADLVVYSKKGTPYFVIECKAPTVNISEKTLLQVFEYNKVLGADYVMVTNGKESFCFSKQNEKFVQTEETEKIFAGYRE